MPLVFCLVFFKKLHTNYLKVFFIYSLVLAIFILTSFSTLLFLNDKQLYLSLVSIYVIIEYIIISAIFFYYTTLRSFKIIILLITAFSGTLLFLNHFYLKNEFISNYKVVFTSLILIVYIIVFFYYKMKRVSSVPLYQTISFWIFVAFFLYYTGNFFFFLIIGSEQPKDVQNFLLLIYSGVTILKNIVLCISFRYIEPSNLNNQNLSIPTDLNLDDLSHINQNSDT